MSGPVVVLVGPPGAGKSTVGALVAQRLGVAFRDTDDDVEADAGKPITDIFVDDGEPAFRALERAAVERALAEHDGVLALGSGAVLAVENREALVRSGSQVVHISASPRASFERVGLATSRPVLALNPRAMLTKLAEERAPLYAEVATAVVETDGAAPEDVAQSLLEAIGRG